MARSRSRTRSAGRRRRRSSSPARRKRSESKSSAHSSKRSRSRRRTKDKSRSASRPRRVRRPRSRSPERIPPTDFADYEPSAEGGWYVYKKTGKWKYHPETGLYLHAKSMVYYLQKENDARSFRKIDDDDDPVVKKMKQSEEMRKAIQATDFVVFGDGGSRDAQTPGGAPGGAGTQIAGPSERPPQEIVEEENPLREGRVQKWDNEKGFGFVVEIAPDGKMLPDKPRLFVHRKNIVGSTPTSHINLIENGRVIYKEGTQDDRPCALEVMMLGADGKPLAVHARGKDLEEKKKSYYVTAAALGLRVHAESWPGLKKTLQDRYVSDEAMEELGVYFSVFDGHGGTQVADHAAKQLHKNILAHFRQKQVQPASRDEKIRQAIKEAYLQCDREILAASERKKYELVGSTAITVLLHGNPKLGTALRLVVANLGDSRAVLCRAGQAVAVSEDHKPSRIDERKRIERAGGVVLQIRGCWRVAAPTNPNSMSKTKKREYQGLAMTRSLGDLFFKRPIGLVSAEPDVQIVGLTDKDLCLVMATDGVFDMLNNQEVVDLAMKYPNDPEEAAKNIVRTATRKGSEDNVTALVIQFGWSDKNINKYKSRMGTATSANQDLAPVGGVMKSAADDCDMFG